MRRMRARSLCLDDEVRQRHGLAEFLAAAGWGGRDLRGPHVADGPDRSPLRRLRGASRARIRRWPAADRIAILYQRTCADLREQGVTTQRSILTIAIALSLIYVWLRGGFIGITAVGAEVPAPAPQLQ